MGFEMGFAKDIDVEIYNDENVYWQSCGWEFSDFYKYLSRFASKTIDEYTCVVPVKSLDFIAEIYKNLKQSKYIQDIKIITTVDHSYLDKFFDSLSMFEIVGLMGNFYQWTDNYVVEDICSFLWRQLRDDGNIYLIQSLGEAIETMKKRGLEEIYIWQSF